MLGAGFGGLELITTLSSDFGDAIDLVLIDQNESSLVVKQFVAQSSWSVGSRHVAGLNSA